MQREFAVNDYLVDLVYWPECLLFIMLTGGELL
jgi:hypothetical protein